MTPQELKNSILQRAIEGKLVEQRKEEGTGEELYKLIQEEKKKLVKEGNLKKQKPLPEITDDEIPFDIPESWKWVRVGMIFQHNTGKALNAKNREGVELEYITTSNLYWDRFELENLKKMYFKDTEYEKNSVSKGDLLVCEGGDVGRAAIWDNEYSIMIQNHIHRLRPYHKLITRFFYYLFYFYKNIGLIGGKGIGIKGLSTKALSSIVFPLPPLAEQERIVEKIEDLMPLVGEYEKNWQRLEDLNKKFPEDLKKSLLQEAIKGRLVEQRKEEGTGEELFELIKEEKDKLIKEGKIKKQKPLPEITEEEIPFDIPESWKWVRLGDVFQFINGDRGKNYPAKSKLKEIGDIPFISAINLRDGTVDENNLLYLDLNQYEKLGSGKLLKNDIVICIRGSLGKNCIYPFEKGAIASSLVILRNYKKIKLEFVLNYLNSYLFYSETRKYDNGTAQPNLSAQNAKKILLPLPPLAEQKRIVEKLEELLPLCEQLIKN